MPVAGDDAPCHRDQQSDGQVRDIIGQHVRRVRHDHPAGSRVVHVDGIHADAEAADNLKIGQGVYQSCRASEMP